MKKQKSTFLQRLLIVGLTVAAFTSCNQETKKTEDSNSTSAKFKGKIALDIRDSESDWTAYTP